MVSKCEMRKTYVSRDSTACPSTAEAILELVRHNAPKDGVDIEGLLICGEIVETEPKTRCLVCRVEMYFICNTPEVWCRFSQQRRLVTGEIT